MDRVFLDADVILDLYVTREPHHELALKLFTHLKRSGTECFTSAVVIANVYYVLSKIQNQRYALDKVQRLRKLLAVAPVTEAVVDAALGSGLKDFEDSIQLNCALQHGIQILITRNLRDYPKDKVRVTDPLQYLSAAALTKRGST